MAAKEFKREVGMEVRWKKNVAGNRPVHQRDMRQGFFKGEEEKSQALGGE